MKKNLHALPTLAALLFSFLLFGLARPVAAQTGCGIYLSDLNPPVACLGGSYQVCFTAPCLAPPTGPFHVEISQVVNSANPVVNFSPPVARSRDTTWTGGCLAIRIPTTLDTLPGSFYYIEVVYTGPGGPIKSNRKAITIRPVDRGPKPVSTISVTPVKLVYCPQDTVTFEITSLTVGNNIPPASYQWRRNGNVIAGATRSTLRYVGLLKGDCFSLLVTKGNPCALNDTGSSNKICLEVKGKPTVTLNTLGSACSDSTTRFLADTANVGRGGRIVWFLGNRPIPNTGPNPYLFILRPGVATCGQAFFARVYTTDCPDSVTSNILTIQSCGRVRVDNVAPTTFCAGDSIRIAYTTFNCFLPANVFTFQLSSPTGSFASPIEIGSVADTNSGTATIFTPAGLASGTGYRLRIVSTAPVGISLNTFGPLTINARPQTPQAINARRCGPGRLVLRATATGATSFNWYTAATGGTTVLSGPDSLVVFLIEGDTTFFVEAIGQGGCPSLVRTPVTGIIGTPVVVSAGPDQTVCQAGDCTDLLGGSPAGGTYAGVGVSLNGLQFCPGVLPAGVYTVRYRYISSEGCADSATKTVTIAPVPEPNAGTQDSAVCQPGPPFQFQLQGFSPAGGTWSGSPAVSAGGRVDVALLRSPQDTLVYTVAVGSCSRTDFRVLRPIPTPTFRLTVRKPVACLSPTGSITIVPFRTDWTINYSNSTGPIGTNVQTLSGLVAGTYTVEVINSTGCSSRQDVVIEDSLGPNPTITNLDTAYCTGDACVQLLGVPPGGTFSSQPSGAVTSSGLFCPTNAGTGLVRVFYAVTDLLTGCVGSDTATTIIRQSPGLEPELDTTVCANAGRFLLSDGGNWQGSPAISLIAGRYYFTPSLATGIVNIITKSVAAVGCSATITRTIIVNPTSAPTISPSGTQRVCQGDSITLNSSSTVGGTVFVVLRAATQSGPFLNFANGTSVRIGQSGVYRVLGLSGLCPDTSSQSLTVIIDSIGTVTIGRDTSVCENAGPITLGGLPAGGTLSGPGASGPTFNPAGLVGQTVRITYTVRNGFCADSASRNVTILPAPVAALTPDGPAASCNGPVILRATPVGSFLYIYRVILPNGRDSLLSSTTGNVLVATKEGSYYVVVLPTTPGGCGDTSDLLPVIISAPPVLPTLTNISACAGDGSISLPSVAGGVYSATVGVNMLSPGNYVFSPTASGPGVFPIKLVVTQGACKDSTTLLATVGAKPSFTATVTDASACNTADGIIDLGTIDTTLFRVQLFPLQVPAQRGPRFVNLRPALYTLIVTDRSTGCDSIRTILINAPDNFRARINGALPFYCTNDGAASLTGTPAGGTFTFLPGGSDSPGPLPAPVLSTPGSYTVIYSVDSAGCTGLDTARFEVRQAPTATLAPQDSVNICSGRSAILTANAGTGFSYIFTNTGGQGTTTTNNVFQATLNGLYQVQVIDRGCSSLSNVVRVLARPSPGAGITIVGQSPACQGASVSLVATGTAPTSYQWFQGPGFTQQVSTSSQITVRQAGSYRVIVSNGSCTDTSAAQQIDFNPRPPAAITANGPNNPCQGTPLTLTANPSAAGFRYVWFRDNDTTGDTTATISVTQAGNYQVRVTSINGGCDSLSAGFQLSPVARPINTVTVSDTAICQGGVVTLTADEPNATSYSWISSQPVTGSGRSVTVNQTGTYYLRIANEGCLDSSRVITIQVDSLPTARIVPDSNRTVCQDDLLILQAQAGAGNTYVWTGQANSNTTSSYPVDTRTPGDYTISVNVTTARGCSATALPVRVQVRQRPVAAISSLGDTSICQGQSVFLLGNAFPGASASFLQNNRSFSTGDRLQANQAGFYSFVLNLAGCADTSRQIRVRLPNLGTVIAGRDSQVCVSSPPFALRGFSPLLNGTTPQVRFLESYIAADIFDPSQAGTGRKSVTLAVTDSGCTVTDTAFIIVVPGFGTRITPPSSIVCAQTNVTLSPVIEPRVPGTIYNYQWRKGRFPGVDITGATDSTYASTDSGQYYVVVTATGTSCQSLSAPATVNYFPFDSVKAGLSIAVCQGDPAFALTNGTPTGGVYSGLDIKPNGQFNPDSATIGRRIITYTTNQLGCQLVDTLTITVNPRPTVVATVTQLLSFGGNKGQVIDIGDSIQLNVTGADTYTWTPPGSLDLATGPVVKAKPTSTTVYTVVGTTAAGCSSSDTVRITVRTDVRVANAFSPNADSENDVWNIYNIQAYPDANIKVYNRWGALVHEATGKDPYWNGEDDQKKEQVPVGTYYYVIDLNNNVKPFVGSITLLR